MNGRTRERTHTHIKCESCKKNISNDANQVYLNILTQINVKHKDWANKNKYTENSNNITLINGITLRKAIHTQCNKRKIDSIGSSSLSERDGFCLVVRNITTHDKCYNLFLLLD